MDHPRFLDLAFEVYGIDAPAKLLLIVMSKLGNASGQCFASQQTLARMCGYSVRTVRRYLTYLRRNKFVTRIPNPKGSTDRYLLNSHEWRGADGQAVRSKGPKLPMGSGQIGRQNLNQNLKVNLDKVAMRPERFSKVGRVDHDFLQILNRLGVAVEEKDSS